MALMDCVDETEVRTLKSPSKNCQIGKVGSIKCASRSETYEKKIRNKIRASSVRDIKFLCVFLNN